MSTSALERYLDQVEQALDAASDSLVSGSAEEIAESCNSLQQLAVSFLQMTDEVGRDALRALPLAARVKAFSERLSPLMEALLRQSAHVSQALKIVVPTENWATYSASLGVNSSSQYGTATRQSGTFKYFAA